MARKSTWTSGSTVRTEEWTEGSVRESIQAPDRVIDGRSARFASYWRLAAFCVLASWAAFVLVKSLPLDGQLRDFGSFVAPGHAAAAGLDPYGVYPLTYRTTYGNVTVEAPNLNPPISVLVFEAVSSVDPVSAFRGWYVISLILYVITVGMLVREYPGRFPPIHVAWAFGFAGFWGTLHWGQIYAPLALITTGAWLLLRRRHYAPAGLLIGALVAIKPNFFSTFGLLVCLAAVIRADVIKLKSGSPLKTTTQLRVAK
jgi:hypothetical protein